MLHLRLDVEWFRNKDVFAKPLALYERELMHSYRVALSLNAGNMIYTMMRRLRVGVDWEKQAILIASYRDLIFKLSYVSVVWYDGTREYLDVSGEKSDVTCALSFLSQVYPQTQLSCELLGIVDRYGEEDRTLTFQVQNGGYVGENAAEIEYLNDRLPNIWNVSVYSNDVNLSEQNPYGVYDPYLMPQEGQPFVLPDNLSGYYLPMQQRFVLADEFGTQIHPMDRHNISASLIKDFEDMIFQQTQADYTVYQMRYNAFMNKVHELERLMGGLEISCYDILPIGEKGLPFASDLTISRTNQRDCNSLKYLGERLDVVKSAKEKRSLMKEIGRSVIRRIEGYDTEYQMYLSTEASPTLCLRIHEGYCQGLYEDFAAIDARKILEFPTQVYRKLCNVPDNKFSNNFERQKIRTFGNGYSEYLTQRLHEETDAKKRKLYLTAQKVLQTKYHGN